MKNKKDTLESSIKILTDLTMSDLEYCKNSSFGNKNEMIIKKNNDSHPFFDWDSWTFVEKKIV